jgi:OmcA/MtrC family decaheme c-type cytochrome
MAHFRPSFFKVAIALLTLTLAVLMAADPVRRVVGTTRQLQASPQAAAQASPRVAAPAPSQKLPREAQLDPNQANFIRPGITVKIVSASIGQDGTITARVNIADPKGLPLDRDGINTPGTVSMSFIAAYIPAGKTQYVSYSTTTLKATLNSNAAQIQAANDSGGTITRNADGDYTYTFKTKAPAGFDASATHAIGVSVNRNLTEFMTYDEWSEVANDVFNFVPNGAAVPVARSVVTTDACNNCHNPLIGHGGSRLKVELCILCHTPQTVNPDTLLTQDMPVLIHKIHMGSSLPSVKAGTPYRIWHRGAWSDFSDVVFPQDIRNCTVCHVKEAPQADNWKTNPSIAACGSCHDNVNFATGENHVDYPVFDEKECKNCHDSTMGWELDASIPGAHIVPNNAASLPGIVTKVLNVENAVPGAAPVVTFSVNDKAGKPVDISKLTQIRVLLAGPNKDYQTGPGGIRVSENPSSTPGSNGVYRYTMTNKIPAAAAGSYTVSIEARNTVTMYPGTLEVTSATDSAKPVEFYFTVDNSKLVPRRVVVTTEKCAACHQNLNFVHGGTRGSTQECVLCHNPTLVDGTSKQSVNYAWQIHSIHRGEALANPYVLGTTNYQDVRFPGDLRVCTTCHVNNSYWPENIGAAASVASPGSSSPTTPPISAACQGCHDDATTAAHTLDNTSPRLGESCVVCHGADDTFSVDKVHSR